MMHQQSIPLSLAAFTVPNTPFIAQRKSLYCIGVLLWMFVCHLAVCRTKLLFATCC